MPKTRLTTKIPVCPKARSMTPASMNRIKAVRTTAPITTITLICCNRLPCASLVNNMTVAIALPRAPDGHYYVTAEMNGTEIDFLVDTGASDIVLSRKDAARIGFDLDELAFLGSARTANGVVPIAYSRLKTIRLGPYLDQGISVSINGGEMDKSLLGMSYLGRFGRIEIAQDQLILRR